MAAVQDGVGSGLQTLFESGLETAEELRHELLRQHPPDEVRGTKAGAVWCQTGPSCLFKKGVTELDCYRLSSLNQCYTVSAGRAVQVAGHRGVCPVAAASKADVLLGPGEAGLGSPAQQPEWQQHLLSTLSLGFGLCVSADGCQLLSVDPLP